jgi:hypothetical protein
VSARTWRDATQVLIDVIGADASMAVYPAVPNPRPEEFITVRRSGGRIDTDAALDVARMVIQVWSGEPNTSVAPAWALASTVREAIRVAAGADGISRWDEETCGFLSDELSDCPTVMITGSLYLRPA